MTTLESQRRGDTFERSFTLGNGWTGASFTGGVKFTLRTKIPPSSTVTDADAVDQASIAGGEITIVDDEGTIVIPAERTTTWPVAVLLWDLQGVISGDPDVVRTIDSGSIRITGDVTRSTADEDS